jgi:hypothetical protein
MSASARTPAKDFDKWRTCKTGDDGSEDETGMFPEILVGPATTHLLIDDAPSSK